MTAGRGLRLTCRIGDDGLDRLLGAIADVKRRPRRKTCVSSQRRVAIVSSERSLPYCHRTRCPSCYEQILPGEVSRCGADALSPGLLQLARSSSRMTPGWRLRRPFASRSESTCAKECLFCDILLTRLKKSLKGERGGNVGPTLPSSCSSIQVRSGTNSAGEYQSRVLNRHGSLETSKSRSCFLRLAMRPTRMVRLRSFTIRIDEWGVATLRLPCTSSQ